MVMCVLMVYPQLVELADGMSCEVELNFLDDKFKAVTIYFGDFAKRCSDTRGASMDKELLERLPYK